MRALIVEGSEMTNGIFSFPRSPLSFSLSARIGSSPTRLTRRDIYILRWQGAQCGECAAAGNFERISRTLRVGSGGKSGRARHSVRAADSNLLAERRARSDALYLSLPPTHAATLPPGPFGRRASRGKCQRPRRPEPRW